MSSPPIEQPRGGALGAARPRLHDQRARSVGTITLVIGLYCLLALLEFSPLSPLDRSRLPNGALGDPPQMVWFLAYTPWALLHGHNPFVTNYLDYPGGVNLASNTSAPLLGLLFAPVTLSLGPIAALNLALRLALATSASAMFLVLRRWCRSPVTAAIGGLVYGFGPYLATHLRTEGHLDLVFAPIPPLLALAFDEAFCSQRHRAVPVGILAGLAAGAQLLISPETLSDSVLVGALALVGLAIAFPAAVGARLAHGLLAAGSAVVSFAVIAGWPLYEMLGGPGHLRGPLQSVAHLQSFRADLLEPFLPGPNELVAPSTLVHATAVALRPIIRAGGSAEVGGYLGLPLVLLLVVLLVWQRRERVLLVLAALAALSFVASLGSRLEVDGTVTSIPLPEALLGHLPILDDTVPARFGLLVLLFCAMALAIGLDRALWLPAGAMRPRVPAPVALVIGVATLITLVTIVPRAPLESEQPAVAPSVAATLAEDVPVGAVVLAYPYPDPPFDLAMLWPAIDKMGFRLVGGYATVNGSGATGQFFPPLVAPEFIQEELSAAEAGRPRHYPAPDPATNGSVALCQFLVRFDVGAVLYAPSGPESASVRQLFVTTLGAPSSTGSGLSIWRLGTRAGSGTARSGTARPGTARSVHGCG